MGLCRNAKYFRMEYQKQYKYQIEVHERSSHGRQEVPKGKRYLNKRQYNTVGKMLLPWIRSGVG